MSPMTATVDVEYGEESLLEMYSGVSVSIVRITPGVAKEMLRNNTKNRNLNARHVKHLREILEQGDMVFNGEAIIFGADGVLLNGQHRLHAVVESGVSFDCLVVRGVDTEVFKTLDAGRKRQTAEALSMLGEGNTTALATAIQAIVSFVDHGGKMSGTCVDSRKATPALAQRVLEAYPQVRSSVAEMSRSTHMRNQHGYCLHFMFSLVNSRLAGEFADVLASGSDDRWRPFNVLREHMIKNPMSLTLRRSHCAKTIKAFNAECVGARPKIVGFSKNEEFPKILGLNIDKVREAIG